MHDFWLILAGTVATYSGVLLGRVARRKPAEPKPPKPPKALCGCTHELAMHDPSTNSCHAQVKQPNRYDGYGNATAYTYVDCSCRQYTGPKPIDTYFAPPMLPAPEE